MRQNSNLVPTQSQQGRGMVTRGRQGLDVPGYTQSPWAMMRRMQEDMDRVFGQFFGGGFGSVAQFNELEQWSPNIDISQTEGEWSIEADLPGVKQEDIHLETRNGQLILRAELKPAETETTDRQYHQRERRYGFFERVLPLPENVKDDAITCDFKDGVLKVHLPKTETAANQPRRIPIGQSAGVGGAEAGKSPTKAEAGQGSIPAGNSNGGQKHGNANGSQTESREPVGAGKASQ